MVLGQPCSGPCEIVGGGLAGGRREGGGRDVACGHLEEREGMGRGRKEGKESILRGKKNVTTMAFF